MILRCIPGHYWVRLHISRHVRRDHGWMYRGLIRRDAWRIGPAGLVILRMPRGEKHWEGATSSSPPSHSVTREVRVTRTVEGGQ